MKKTFRIFTVLAMVFSMASCELLDFFIDKSLSAEFGVDPEVKIVTVPGTEVLIPFEIISPSLEARMTLLQTGLTAYREYTDESKMRGVIHVTTSSIIDSRTSLEVRITNGYEDYDLSYTFSFEAEQVNATGDVVYDMDADGGTFSLSYEANVETEVVYAPAGVDWISIQQTKALSTFTLNFVVEANDGMPRSATVKVRSADAPGIYATYTVNQAADYKTFSFTTNDTKVTVPALAGTGCAANVYWNASLHELWRSGLSHTYTTTPNTVIIETVKTTSFTFDRLSGITEIDLTKFKK